MRADAAALRNVLCLPLSVVLDFTATGLSLRQHPLALLREQLQQLGLHDTGRHGTARSGSWVKVPGWC